MSGKYKGKYRDESARLQGWDYGNPAAYLPGGRRVLSPFAPKTGNIFLVKLKTAECRYPRQVPLPMYCGMK